MNPPWYRARLPVAIRKGVNGFEPYSGGAPDFAQVWLANK